MDDLKTNKLEATDLNLKRCSRCYEDKDKQLFTKTSSLCKECRREYDAQRRTGGSGMSQIMFEKLRLAILELEEKVDTLALQKEELGKKVETLTSQNENLQCRLSVLETNAQTPNVGKGSVVKFDEPVDKQEPVIETIVSADESQVEKPKKSKKSKKKVQTESSEEDETDVEVKKSKKSKDKRHSKTTVDVESHKSTGRKKSNKA
jgi:hypothetical protein